MKKPELALIKLGGGAITDKNKPYSLKKKDLKNLAAQISQVKTAYPDLRLIVANGAGSFGHYTVKHYLQAAKTAQQKKYAVAQVAASVRQLNDLVVAELLANKLSAFSISPSSIMVRKKTDDLWLESILSLLEQNMTPVLYGDIVMDDKELASVMSTEEVFSTLAKKLTTNYFIKRVIYITSEPGVLDDRGKVIVKITPAQTLNLGTKKDKDFDVTGGMLTKLDAALAISKLAEKVYIIDANEDNLLKAIKGQQTGTQVG